MTRGQNLQRRFRVGLAVAVLGFSPVGRAADVWPPAGITVFTGPRSGEFRYQPKFPWWEPFETRVYPVIHKDPAGNRGLLLVAALQGDRRPQLQSIEFLVDGNSTVLGFEKAAVDRSGCRVVEFVELDGLESLIRSLATASDARVIFRTKKHRQDHIFSVVQQEGFAAVLELHDLAVLPVPQEDPAQDRELTMPKNLKRVPPDYPDRMVARGKRGRVIVNVRVLKEGAVEILDVVASDSPYCGFEESALQAIRQWRYSPGMKSGQAVEVPFTIVMDFSIR